MWWQWPLWFIKIAIKFTINSLNVKAAGRLLQWSVISLYFILHDSFGDNWRFLNKFKTYSHGCGCWDKMSPIDATRHSNHFPRVNNFNTQSYIITYSIYCLIYIKFDILNLIQGLVWRRGMRLGIRLREGSDDKEQLQLHFSVSQQQR